VKYKAPKIGTRLTPQTGGEREKLDTYSGN